MNPVMTGLHLFLQNALNTRFRLSFFGWGCATNTAASTLLRTNCYAIKRYIRIHIKLVICAILLKQFEQAVFCFLLLFGSEFQFLIH